MKNFKRKIEDKNKFDDLDVKQLLSLHTHIDDSQNYSTHIQRSSNLFYSFISFFFLQQNKNEELIIIYISFIFIVMLIIYQ